MTGFYLILFIVKGLAAFFGIMQIIRLCGLPGFAQMVFEGDRTGKNVLLNNTIFLIICWGIFFVMGFSGINFLS